VEVAARPTPRAIEPRSLPQFALVRADITRFPADEERDDVRVLNVQLRLDGVREAIPLDRLGVEVTFFDRAGDPPRVFPSRHAPGPRRFTLTGDPWRPGEVRQLTFSYVIPRGGRQRDFREQGAEVAYYGYRLKVLYDGAPVAVHARPQDLAELR